MCNIKSLILLLLTPTLLLSCSDDYSTSHNLLLQAQDLLEKDSKQALSLLESIASPKEMGQESYMQYLITYVETKRKNNLSIAEDTLIFEAQKYYNKKGNSKQTISANFYSGSVCYQGKIWDRSISSFQQAIQYAHQANDDLTIAKSYHTLGFLYNDNNLLDSAILNFNKALDYYNKLVNVDIHKMQVLIGLGFVYDSMNKFDDAENYFKQSFEIANQTKNKLFQGYGNQNLGLVCLERKNYNDALTYFQKALPNMANAADSIKIYLNLSKLYTETNKLDSAAFYMNSVKQSLPEIQNNWTLRYAYSVLKVYFEKERNFEKALYYSTRCDSVRQIINNQDLVKQLHDAETKREIAINNEKAKAKQDMLVMWIGASYVALFLLFLCGVIYVRSRWKIKRQRIELEVREKIAQEEKKKEIAEVRDTFFQFNTRIHYKIMNEWKEICSKLEEKEEDINKTDEQESLYPRMGKTISSIHRKTSYRLVSLGKEFLRAEDNGEKALRFMKDQEILCMMLAYHRYPLRVVISILDEPITKKEFLGILGAIGSKLRYASFTEERINEILYGKTQSLNRLV